MSPRSLHLFRRAFGLLLASIGLAALVADLHVAYLARGAAHLLNIVVGSGLVFAGGLLLDLPTAESIADAIAKRIPVVQSMWPGGRRRDDPPPQPGVPPPPSVTGEHKP